MSRAMQLRTLMANESRALAPAWMAALAAATVAALTRGDAHQFSQFAYATATVALGAQSVGHDDAHRTVGVVWTLPVDRSRLFAAKMIVAAALVLPLTIVGSQAGLFADVPALRPWHIAIVALGLAPFVTIRCRSQLAGTIFSLSVPWLVLIALLIASGTPWDLSNHNERAVLTTWSRAIVAMSALGAVMAGWSFRRLEAVEGRAMECAATWASGTHDARPAHPLWQLVKKELRLQQLTMAVTVLYLGVCAIAVVFQLPGPVPAVSFLGAATVIYVLGIPTLVGSLATAEERQLGTLAWQLQLPAPAWQQWTVKALMVFGLALLLSLVVPSLVLVALRPIERSFVGLPIVFAIVTTAVSMYVSSLCTSAVRAVVTAVVVDALALRLILVPSLWQGRERAFILLLSLVVLLLVRFASLNHRQEPPSAARIWRQTLSLALVALAGVAVLVVSGS